MARRISLLAGNSLCRDSVMAVAEWPVLVQLRLCSAVFVTIDPPA